MTILRKALAAATVFCIGLAAGCNAPDVSKDAPQEPAAQASGTQPAPEPTAAPTSDLDFGALQDRQDPERLLRYYAAAVRVGDWEDAAKAWSSDALVSAATLRQQYGSGALPNLVIGKGDTESAAGTEFYQAPIVVDFPAETNADRRGTIVLRRADDVPGASEEQLNWRIERSSVLEAE